MSVDGEPEPVRSEARRRAILEVARDVFLDKGYAAASMSEIAARLGGSKGTLYNYFSSKEELFAAFIAEVCRKVAAALYDQLPAGEEDLRQGLIDFGCVFLDFLMREDVMSVHRLVVAESGRFPHVGQTFYEQGPRRGELRLAEFFGRLMDAGQIRRGDPRRVGQQLKDLLLSDFLLRLQWGVIERPSPEQARAHVTDAVDVFLRAFAL
jgi:AcrR family transcriptional regulator